MSLFVSGFLALAPPLFPPPNAVYSTRSPLTAALLSERLEQANLFFERLSKSYQKKNVSNPFSQQFHRIMYAENILS